MASQLLHTVLHQMLCEPTPSQAASSDSLSSRERLIKPHHHPWWEKTHPLWIVKELRDPVAWWEGHILSVCLGTKRAGWNWPGAFEVQVRDCQCRRHSQGKHQAGGWAEITVLVESVLPLPPCWGHKEPRGRGHIRRL